MFQEIFSVSVIPALRQAQDKLTCGQAGIQCFYQTCFYIIASRNAGEFFNLFGLIPRRLRRNFFCRVGRQGYRLPTRIETPEQRERVTAQPLGTRRPPPCGDESAPPLAIPRPLGRGCLFSLNMRGLVTA